MNKLIRILKNPTVALGIFVQILLVRFSFLFNDKMYLSIRFWLKMGYKINWEKPKSFNEKLNWIKLYDRNPKYIILADKVKAKDFVSSILGNAHIIPTLGVWDDPEKISFDKLPNRFVLKCNHNSGLGMFICKDKNQVTPKQWKKVKRNLLNGLKQDYYIQGREWPYKDIPRRILCEQFIESKDGDLKDYKFFCFNGEVKFLKVDFNRFIDHRANYYSLDWNLLPFGEVVCPPKSEYVINRPLNLNEMVDYAIKLSKNIPFVRVDFYDVNNIVYFGEMTFFPAEGTGKFFPKSADLEIGELLELPCMSS